MSREVLRLRLFAGLTLLSAVAALSATLAVQRPAPSPLLIALVLVAAFSEVLPVQLASMTVSITTAVCAAATILLGPAAGGLVTGVSAVPASLMVKEQPILRGSFNVGQLTLAALAGGWVYTLAGGRPLGAAPLTGPQMPGMMLPLAGLAVGAFLINTTFVGAFIAIRSETPFLTVWKSSFVWTVPAQAALAVLALALAQVVASEGIVGLALFVVPLMIARQFYERYMLLKRTYADTVRSLVAVIEAKDLYTKGHSERVAAYSVDIARRLGLGNQKIERIELAALLHDLGKVGISRSILLKSSPLTDEELSAIKMHPEIGARIIENVPFLADLVPLISAHHERIDGTGYGSQLAGEAIPIEARILGVADAFDAMTSSRPYRAAMSREDTVFELTHCAGEQFDRVIVETFIESLADGNFGDSPPGWKITDEAV
ncbi:MAG TPA: HD-GYP domain-containing protein [Coriobacteriia bacterium]|jgi:hypothetical protein